MSEIDPWVGKIPRLGRSPEGDYATHSSILAWRIPMADEPGRLQSIGSQRVRQDWMTKHSTYASEPQTAVEFLGLEWVLEGRGKTQQVNLGKPCSCPQSLWIGQHSTFCRPSFHEDYVFKNNEWKQKTSLSHVWLFWPHGIIHGILQARILEWIAVPFSRGSSQPRDQTQVSRIARWTLYQLIHQGSPKNKV